MLADPSFTMFWDLYLPRRRFTDANGRTTTVTVNGGALDGESPLPPPPHSWAADPNADLAIWSIAMEDGAVWTVPPARGAETVRALHLFAGAGVKVGDRPITGSAAIRVHADQPVTIEAVNGPIEILLLQGRPIGEPVAQHGPFVMNTQAELQQAFNDYRRTQFGGWPWPEHAPVHPRDAGRFAKHADGRVERAS
jgi:redox-sensitive bicupin YhaK (pirin superfamily)